MTAYEFTMKKPRATCPARQDLVQNPKLMEVMVPLGALLPRSFIAIQSRNRDCHKPDQRSVVSGLLYRTRNDAEKDGGLPPEKVEGADRGTAYPLWTTPAAVVYESHVGFSCAPRLPMGIYRRAVSLLGHPGLTDLDRLLIGYFTCVSLSLMLTTCPPVPSVYSVAVNFSFRCSHRVVDNRRIHRVCTN